MSRSRYRDFDFYSRDKDGIISVRLCFLDFFFFFMEFIMLIDGLAEYLIMF